MYICQVCGKASKPGEKRATRVVQTRTHTFPYRSKVNRIKREGHVEWLDDRGGVGEQIVLEKHGHERCLA